MFVGYKVFVEFKGLGQYLMEWVSDLPNVIRSAESWIISRLAILPDSIEKSATDAISGVVDNLLLMSEDKTAVEQPEMDLGSFDLSFITAPLGGLLSTAKQIPVIIKSMHDGGIV